MANRFILLDGGAIENLYSAGGELAWSQLLKTGNKITISELVLSELGKIRDTINQPGTEFHGKPNPNFGLADKFRTRYYGDSQCNRA